MQVNNQSVAYDLSGFGTRQTAVVTPKLHVVEQKKGNPTVSIYSAISTILTVGVIFSIIAMILYSNAMINEIGAEVSTLNSQYNALVNENKKLTSDLESKVSIRNVEEYARDNLGLSKMDAYQIEYVNMAPTDKIEVVSNVEKENNIIDTVLGFINSSK